MNIAEFVGRMREQADRIEGFADEAAEASDVKREVCLGFINSELNMLEARIEKTRGWLREQQGGETDGEATEEGRV